MLASLHIENVAVIKELDLDFDRGFTAFTGETGAGKSIIIDSIRLLLGSKADREVIRQGENSGVVYGLFCSMDSFTLEGLAELDVYPDENGELTLYRSVSLDGPSKAKINGKSVPVSLLNRVGKYLLAIHGQHDSMTLLDEGYHVGYLDGYGEIGGLVESYSKVYKQLSLVKNKLKEESEQAKNNEYRIKSLTAAVKEISLLNLRKGDYQRLCSKRDRLRDAEKVSKNAGIIYKTLYKSEKAPGCATLIDLAVSSFEKLSSHVEGSEGYIERLRAISLELEEIANEAKALCADGDFEDPAAALDEVEQRLEAIERAMRKYGEGEDELLSYLENAKNELNLIQNSGKRLEEYKKEMARLSKQAFALGEEIHNKRSEAAKSLEKQLGEELKYLDLDKARFKIEVNQSCFQSGGVKLLPNGCDTVEFLISANLGEEPKSIAKVASGGELSRIMMALRTVFAGKDGVGTMIFDEIDTGVSGKTSEKIGIKLKSLGEKGLQVFSVTHSAQVAAVAANHLKISKHEVDGKTQTFVQRLDLEGRVDELSRIMGGIVESDNIRRSAREMIMRSSSPEK